MIIKQHHDSSIVTFFEKDRDHFLILFNRASLNCLKFSCIIIETRILHLVSERRMAPCFGSLVFQRSWNRCATTSSRKTCRPSCTWWTTRSTGAARPAPSTFCSWPATWGFLWSRGTRITRDWREWVDANLPFPFSATEKKKKRGGEGGEKSTASL